MFNCSLFNWLICYLTAAVAAVPDAVAPAAAKKEEKKKEESENESDDDMGFGMYFPTVYILMNRITLLFIVTMKFFNYPKRLITRSFWYSITMIYECFL